jgi:hypothetical protein
MKGGEYLWNSNNLFPSYGYLCPSINVSRIKKWRYFEEVKSMADQWTSKMFNLNKLTYAN